MKGTVTSDGTLNRSMSRIWYRQGQHQHVAGVVKDDQSAKQHQGRRHFLAAGDLPFLPGLLQPSRGWFLGPALSAAVHCVSDHPMK